MRRKKLRHSLASYIENEGAVCDLEELAKILSRVNQVPERINLTKATEIALLANNYLLLMALENTTPTIERRG